jgi:gliding motility-associated-like protein
VETIRLLGPSGAIYDAVPYSFQWFGRTTVPKGTSLEKIRPEFNGKIAASWAASVAANGSTPGQPNSVLVSLEKSDETITVSPNPFSPDNDGYEDFLIIRYQIEAPTAIANVRIFDRLGRMIRHLANHVPIGSSGQFVWDGKDDLGRTMPIGSYLCYFQLSDTITQKQRDFVITVILYKK